ncbi:MAG: hypothetical protein LBI87_02235 [Candidatus Accumulibacter sp.]|nr:hypothetical protein [Accumulibacter sp.]
MIPFTFHLLSTIFRMPCDAAFHFHFRVDNERPLTFSHHTGEAGIQHGDQKIEAPVSGSRQHDGSFFAFRRVRCG